MNEREAYGNPHPPTCTCVSCAEKRLRRRKGLWARMVGAIRRKP